MATIFHPENIENAIENVELDLEESFLEEDNLWNYEDLKDTDFIEDVSLNDDLIY